MADLESDEWAILGCTPPRAACRLPGLRRALPDRWLHASRPWIIVSDGDGLQNQEGVSSKPRTIWYNERTMQVISNLEQANLEADTVVTVGSFDGLHRGHQKLFRELIARAKAQGMLSAAVTFYPHPRIVLRPDVQPVYLTTDAERARILDALGLDLLVLIAFTPELAATPAEGFVRRLVEELQMRELWVGPGFALGRGREGEIPALTRLGETLGYTVETVTPMYDNGEPISSTRIRSLLADGHVDRAAELLGRYYALSGTVLHGAERGRRLGFRTANLRVPIERAAPADGVYAVWAIVDDERHPGVANIGIRPSFDAGERLLETHLIGFEDDLYDRHLRIEFVRFLRGEQRFESGAALSAQVQEDIRVAARILTEQVPTE
jgi:riboflavin kinase / FMN adenylyltransferase